MTELNWSLARWEALDIGRLYALLRLRQRVFVLEQTCPFVDCDDLDQNAWHLCGHAADGELRVYARLHAPGVARPEGMISRVVSAPECRRQGLGRRLFSRALDELAAIGPAAPVWIGAQQRLEAFYTGFGFARCSEPYLEDGIWHVGMRRAAPQVP